MPSLFSDGEEEGGLFGGNADDIFEATSPPKVSQQLLDILRNI